MCDPYAGKRPSDYDDAKWVCEEPNIWFEVNSDEEERNELLKKIKKSI